MDNRPADRNSLLSRRVRDGLFGELLHKFIGGQFCCRSQQIARQLCIILELFGKRRREAPVEIRYEGSSPPDCGSSRVKHLHLVAEQRSHSTR